MRTRRVRNSMYNNILYLNGLAFCHASYRENCLQWPLAPRGEVFLCSTTFADPARTQIYANSNNNEKENKVFILAVAIGCRKKAILFQWNTSPFSEMKL